MLIEKIFIPDKFKRYFKFLPVELNRYINQYIPYQKCIICEYKNISYNKIYICSPYCFGIFYSRVIGRASYIYGILLTHKCYIITIETIQVFLYLSYMLIYILHIVVSFSFYTIVLTNLFTHIIYK